MTGIEDTTECRRHCHAGDVEWFGLPAAGTATSPATSDPSPPSKDSHPSPPSDQPDTTSAPTAYPKTKTSGSEENPMCDMTECTATVIEQVIQTGVPGTKPVRLRTCPACDRRRCPACKTNVLNPQATTCPNGHGL